MKRINKHGRISFALSLYCFIAIIAFSLFMLGEVDDESLVPREELLGGDDIFGVIVAETYILFMLVILGCALLAVLPTILKIFQAALCKLGLLKVCIFFDYVFLIIGILISAYLILVVGADLSAATVWSASLVILSFLAIIFDKKGRKRVRLEREIFWY